MTFEHLVKLPTDRSRPQWEFYLNPDTGSLVSVHVDPSSGDLSILLNNITPTDVVDR